jgi:hypothetical protein
MGRIAAADRDAWDARSVPADDVFSHDIYGAPPTTCRQAGRDLAGCTP